MPPRKKPETLTTAFDTYTLGQSRGAGGTGEVFVVRDSSDVAFAAKILDKKKAAPALLQQFRNEFNFCASSTHPNILRIHDRGISKKGSIFYIMPVYPLSLRIMLHTGIAPGNVLPCFGQILDGVEAAHLEHVGHLDLKPENILHSVAEDRTVVADFGMAHFLEEDLLAAAEAGDSERLAQFPYAAPEQKTRGQEVDHRADIFALGLMLNEMFTGVMPQGADTKTIEPIESVAPDYAYLDNMVAWMTSEDPSARPASIDEIKKQLIARGNEFLSRQRLNSLKTSVIPEGEAGDSFLANPIRIVSADYAEGIIYFKLNTNPTPNWIAAFKNPRSAVRFYTGAEPDTFVLNGDSMNVRLPLDADAAQFVQYTKSYIELANGQYREHVIAFHQRQMQAEREVLRRQMAEEERRLRVLTEIRNAI